MKNNKLFVIFIVCFFIFSLSSCTKIGSCKCVEESTGQEHVISKEEADVTSCSKMEKKLNESGSGLFNWKCSFTL